jgi:hypothetical protein
MYLSQVSCCSCFSCFFLHKFLLELSKYWICWCKNNGEKLFRIDELERDSVLLQLEEDCLNVYRNKAEQTRKKKGKPTSSHIFEWRSYNKTFLLCYSVNPLLGSANLFLLFLIECHFKCMFCNEKMMNLNVLERCTIKRKKKINDN